MHNNKSREIYTKIQVLIQVPEKRGRNVVSTDKGALLEVLDKAALVG